MAEFYYITATLHSLQWAFAKPSRTEHGAQEAAVNAVVARLCTDYKITMPKTHFEDWWRTNYPELGIEAKEHIGETRCVPNPDGKAPKAFRAWYCGLSCDARAGVPDAEVWV